MWCDICKNELRECSCPDIEARLRDLQRPGTHVHIPDCPACGKPQAICKCGYVEYHAKVVDECVKLMGEQCRFFFNVQCTFEEGFREKRDPVEEAEGQRDAMS